MVHSSLPNFTPSVQQGIRPKKLKRLLKFDQIAEYKRQAGAYLLHDFDEISRVCTSFHDALAFKT